MVLFDIIPPNIKRDLLKFVDILTPVEENLNLQIRKRGYQIVDGKQYSEFERMTSHICLVSPAVNLFV